ncbi:hypothetical protein HPB52_009155 [Rhipicephalus sanguineus]|uniref:Uncharacterized protein n=1 Tax=Rhipicephalus sanguineus TaxID=34632 RepID=A0A9D4PIJ8_RHISA|nr:hypothetical protein HPB52_009155 [Rhipicephalus sanguineus]
MFGYLVRFLSCLMTPTDRSVGQVRLLVEQLCKPSQLWSLGLLLALLLVLCGSHGASGFLTGRSSNGAGSGGALVASSFLRSLWKRASMRASMRNSMRDSPIYYVSTFVRNKTPAQQQAAVLSPLFKIPIEFMSNARPLDVVKGIRKPSYSKPYRKQSLYQTSKMILMPIKFLANGKPRRRVVIKTPPHYFRI